MSGIDNDPGYENPLFLFSNHPVLATITDDIWKEALRASKVMAFPAGTSLIHCGDTADNFIILLQGTIRVFEAAEDGREICLYRVYQGQACALTLAKLLTRSDQNAQAIADEDVRILVMPIDYYEQLMSRSKVFRNFLMISMANCVNEVMQLVGQVSFKRLDLRVAMLLGRLSEDAATRQITVTHQEIADDLGTTREVISRSLKNFSDLGQVKLGRGSIELLSESVCNETTVHYSTQSRL